MCVPIANAINAYGGCVLESGDIAWGCFQLYGEVDLGFRLYC